MAAQKLLTNHGKHPGKRPEKTFEDYSRGRITSPIIKPPARPSMIGKGKPGKMPLRSSMKNVMIEPTTMPTIETRHGRIPSG